MKNEPTDPRYFAANAFRQRMRSHEEPAALALSLPRVSGSKNRNKQGALRVCRGRRAPWVWRIRIGQTKPKLRLLSLRRSSGWENAPGVGGRGSCRAATVRVATARREPRPPDTRLERHTQCATGARACL